MNKNFILALSVIIASASCANAMESKHYLKGNLGYSMSKQKASGYVNNDVGTNANPYAVSKKSRGMVGGMAIGTSVTPNARVELELLASGGNKSKYAAPNSASQTASMKTTSYTGLVNAAYDFKNSTSLTPFVLVGLGYGSSKHKISVAAKSSNASLVARNFNKSKGGFAYQAGLGVSYAVAPKVSLELGYRFVSHGGKGKAITIDSNNMMKANKRSSTSNVIMGGIRIGL